MGRETLPVETVRPGVTKARERYVSALLAARAEEKIIREFQAVCPHPRDECVLSGDGLVLRCGICDATIRP